MQVEALGAVSVEDHLAEDPIAAAATEQEPCAKHSQQGAVRYSQQDAQAGEAAIRRAKKTSREH